MGRSVGIVSLKGGVGKTSSVIALGDALADFGKKILLVDANFSAPNLGIHLNIINPEVTLHHVLEHAANMKDAIYVVGEKLHVVPSSVFPKKKINPFRLRDSLNNVKKRYNFILIDSSPALNEETLAAMLASDEIFVVTTPDYATLATTLKAVKMAKKRNVPVSGLILNKAYNKNFELSIDDIEKTADVPVLAVIPYDINILRAQAEFVPSTMFKPKSAGSAEYKKLAATMIGKKYEPFSFRELFRKMTPSRQEINRQIFYKRVFE